MIPKFTALVGALLLMLSMAGSASAAAIQDLPGCQQTPFAPSPPGEDGAIPDVQLGFTADFFGTSTQRVSVNENGNVTFDGMRTDFVPIDFATASDIMIAPFLGDVDLRGSGAITYGNGTLPDGTTKYFCVDWLAVGSYNQNSSPNNSFQLLLTQSPAQAPTGDFTITFNYDEIGWDTSDTGESAGVGFSAGDGVPGHDDTQPGSWTAGALVDGAPTGLVEHDLGSDQLGRYVFQVVNAPVSGGTLHGMVYESDMQTRVLYGPARICPATGGACVQRVTNYVGEYNAAGLTPGNYEVTASPAPGDDGTPTTICVAVATGDNQAPEIDLGAVGSQCPTPPGGGSPGGGSPGGASPGGGSPGGGGGAPGPQPPVIGPTAESVRQAAAHSLAGQLTKIQRRVAKRLAARRLSSFAVRLSAPSAGAATLSVTARGVGVAVGRLSVDHSGSLELTVKVTTKGLALERAVARAHRTLKLKLAVAFAPRFAGQRLPVVQVGARFSIRPKAR